MSVRFDDFLQEQLQDPEFKKEYESLQPQHAIIQTIIDSSVFSDAELEKEYADLQTGMSFPMRDVNGFTPAEAKELKRRVADIEEGNAIRRTLVEV